MTVPPPGRANPAKAPEGYDVRDYPAFAVTVDIVILTIVHDRLHVVLIKRKGDPYKGMWALPGGFKRPDETLEEAASRELREETGVEAADHLSQFGAYGDPGRDPRTHVVTVGFLAVLRDVGALEAGTDADLARLFHVEPVLKGQVKLAFDHERILRDAIERARGDLETTSLATAFVGPEFTLSGLRNVFEVMWGADLDAANFQRKVTSEPGWVEPTGTVAPPGAVGGKPARQFRAGRAWRAGAPLRRPRDVAQSDEKDDE